MYAKRNKSVTLLNLVIFLGIKLLIICNHTHLQRPRGGQNKGRGESFQERVREPLECDSYRTSSTTHSNALISLIFVLSQRPASIALLSRSSYANESTFKQQLDCSPYLSCSCWRALTPEEVSLKTEEMP